MIWRCLPSPARQTRSRAAFAFLATIALSMPRLASADFPTPGGAAGTTTGDGARPFTGLAETPRAAAFSGAAITSIPLELPPGRAGATPQLALHYSSGDGASAYGHGWSLPIARVVRSTKHGVPSYDDTTDTFVLESSAGSIELAPIAGTPRYQAKVESAFLRIGFDRARNRWKVIDKSGTVLELGLHEESRMGPGVATSGGTFAWLLERSTDAAGNVIDYSYLAQTDGSGTSGLPARIDYGGNPRAGIGNFLTVGFRWTPVDYPSIVPVSFAAGFAQSRDRLLLAIETFAEGDLVRRYSLSHDEDRHSGAKRLVGVSLDAFAADPQLDVALPSTVFAYTDAVTTDWPVGVDSVRALFAETITAPGPLRQLGPDVRFDTLDINGDGLVDWVDARPAQPIVRLGRAGGFAPAVAWPWPATPRKLRGMDPLTTNLHVNLFDITGDGLPDLVDGRADTCQSRRWCVYRNTGSGFATTAEIWWAPRNDIRRSHAAGDRVVADVADLNGDGRPDWISADAYTASSPYWRVHWNTGSGFSEQPYLFRAHADHISVVADLTQRKALTYGLFDMNGDGLPDFVNADAAPVPSPPNSQTHWNVYLNNGAGFEVEPVEWRIEGASGLPLPARLNETDGGLDDSYTYKDLVDMTGDGRPDWLRPWTAEDLPNLAPPLCDQTPSCTFSGTLTPPQCCFSHLLFVNTGSSFSAPVPWAAWHDYELRHTRDTLSSSERQFDLLDFDGDGLVDLVEITGNQWRIFGHPASPAARWSQTAAEKRGGPNLLLAMMNGVGGETHLAYSAASSFAQSRVPFPYWAVTRRELRDGLSNAAAAVATYRYRGGLWDGAAREFRGFRDVWETDAGGLSTATAFFQDTRLQGLVRETKLLGPEPCPPIDPMDENDPCSALRDRLRVDTNTWTAAGPTLLTARSSTPYYRNVAVPQLAKHTQYAYDAYGNAVREIVSSPSAGSITTDTTYAASILDDPGGMPSRYLVDKPVRTVTRDGPATAVPLSEKRYVYDAPAPLTGLLMRVDSCIDWSGASCARWKSLSYRYDKAGNVSAVIGARGDATETAYDSRLVYARSVRNAVGHVTQSVRDLRTGRETRRIAPGGRVFETDYDGLARPVRTWSTGFSRSSPEVATTYADGVPGGSLGYVRTRQHGSAPVAVFYDGLGRHVAAKSITETASGDKAVVSGRTTYDLSGRTTAKGVVFVSTEPRIEVLAAGDAAPPAWTRYLYDRYGHLRETVLPDGSRTLHGTDVPGVQSTVNPNLARGDDPGSAEIELSDGLGRVWRKDVCNAAPAANDPARCPAGTLLERVDYEHDGLDRPLRIVTAAHSPTPAVTEIAYDGLGNRTRFESSDLGQWRYEYGVDGLLARATDPRGDVMTSRYDKLGRLRVQRARNFKASYAYHQTGGGTGMVRRIRSQSGIAKTGKEFVYDARGRIVEESISMNAGGPSLRNVTAYEYDDADRRISVTYPSEHEGETRRVTTTYSRYGQPIALRAYDGAAMVPLVTRVGRDVLGNVDVVALGNGLTDVFVHQPAAQLGRLACMRTTRSAAPPVSCTGQAADQRRIEVDLRDTAGNITRTIDYLHGATATLQDSRDYLYDSLGRVVRADRTGAASETFSYDVHGNLAARVEGGFQYGSARPHRPTLATQDLVEHDAAGNRTRKGTWTYEYDGLGRLTAARSAGALREAAYYDEGRTRIARLDAETGDLRYYVSGLFEVEGTRLIRHYRLGDRIVASDVIATPRDLRTALMSNATAHEPRHAALLAAAPHDLRRAQRLAGSSHEQEASASRAGAQPDRADRRYAELAFLVLLTAFLLLAATTNTRAGVALVTGLAVLIATTPIPAHAQRQVAAVRRPALSRSVSTAQTFYYHPDHLGSPYMVSDGAGNVLEHRRYDAYGRLRAVYDNAGRPALEPATDVSYTGHTGDPSGLIYFESRYYDPDLGLFLTPDPQAQFASPYLYGGGNPVNGVDPDGEIFGFLAALFIPMLVSTAVTAFVSGLSASLQGGDFLDAFASGAIAGAAGVALGTALGGLNVAYQYFAGGSEFFTAAEAAKAAVEVARRSAFTSAVSNAATSTADAVGLSSDWTTAVGVVTPLFASYAYDVRIIKDSGASGASLRKLAGEGVIEANTAVGHTNVTETAAQTTGWERQTGQLVKYNLREDGPVRTGNFFKDAVGKVRALFSNQEHFGRLPATIDGLRADVAAAAAEVPRAGAGAIADEPFGSYVAAVGRATHYVQDHLSLGHMVPGTRVFSGPLGAPIRFVIHQVFGGEIAFRDAQIRATRTLLNDAGVIL